MNDVPSPAATFKVERRVAGFHDVRLDGISDLLLRCRGASVLDVGCNRGLVGFEFAKNGATTVHGCDNYEIGIQTAREIFADLRSVKNKFEVVDLKFGPPALRPFDQLYDITIMLATYHKLKRVMDAELLSQMVRLLGRNTRAYFGWRATSDKPDENDQEMSQLDLELRAVGLRRIHTSYISDELGVAAIWRKS